MPPPRPEVCPFEDCDGRMHRHGWYPRGVILADGRRAEFGVFRFRCAQCGRTVSFLPDFCVPHKHFCADVICGVLGAVLLLELSLRSVSAADSVHNAASFSRYCAADWVCQFRRNSHNLRHFGLPRLGIARSAPRQDPGKLFECLLRFGSARAGDTRQSLRAVQCALSRPPPPFGLFRAQLLPGCVT